MSEHNAILHTPKNLLNDFSKVFSSSDATLKIDLYHELHKKYKETFLHLYSNSSLKFDENIPLGIYVKIIAQNIDYFYNLIIEKGREILELIILKYNQTRFDNKYLKTLGLISKIINDRKKIVLNVNKDYKLLIIENIRSYEKNIIRQIIKSYNL